MTELILTGATVACMVGLLLFARAQRRDPGTEGELIVFAIGFAILIWAPAWLRSILIGCFVVLAVWKLGPGVFIIMTAPVVASAIWLPGGVSVVLFAIIAIGGLVEIRDARRHLSRIARAAQLVAHQPTDHEVELTGTAHAVHPTQDPVRGGACAMWLVTAKGRRDSETLVEIRGASGSALVDPTNLRLEWSKPATVIKGDEARRAAERLRIDLSDDTLMLNVLLEGAECYVIGHPAWEAAPANVGMYRDGNVLPLFRSTPEHPALFADRSETQLRSDHLWALVSWGTWAALCSVVAVLQVGGWS